MTALPVGRTGRVHRRVPTDCVDPRGHETTPQNFRPLPCHPGESRGPQTPASGIWTPAFAGVTAGIVTAGRSNCLSDAETKRCCADGTIQTLPERARASRVTTWGRSAPLRLRVSAVQFSSLGRGQLRHRHVGAPAGVGADRLRPADGDARQLAADL